MSDHFEETTKAGFVAIIGAPNAGKSTLLNLILGQKLAITTHKVQTTRTNMRGIHTVGNSQFVFVDTPGIHKPRRKFDEAMVNAANQAWQDADAILLLIDAVSGLKGEVMAIIEQVKESKKPVVVALNKVDKIKKENLLPLMQKLGEYPAFTDIFAISAANASGVEDMLQKIETYLPESPFLFDADDLTDTPMRLIAAEITREKAFTYLHQELPYALMVETVSYEVVKNDEKGVLGGSQRTGAGTPRSERKSHFPQSEYINIHQNIIVEREGHKGIVLGNKGETVKKISTESRLELENFLGCKVNLFIKVKVRKNWSENASLMRMIGLEPIK
jgi:GTP-binding protein Era